MVAIDMVCTTMFMDIWSVPRIKVIRRLMPLPLVKMVGALASLFNASTATCIDVHMHR